VELKEKIKNKLRESYGGFSTNLEHKYEQQITENLSILNMKRKREWATYNQVILELKHNLNDMLRVKELQYRLTDEENPTNVCIEVINNVKDPSPELQRLYNKIINF